MKNTIKKSISFLLLSALMFSLFSCADNTQKDKNVPSGTEVTTGNIETTSKLTDGLPDTDMQGYTFNMLNFDTSWFLWRNTRILQEEETGETIDDALYVRQTNIEDRFNCKLTVTEVPQTTDYIKKNVLAGDNTYQLYSLYDQDFGISVPYVLDCNEVPYLKLNEKYWNPDATSLYNFSGKQLALAGNISLGVVSGAGCIAFNKRIWQTYGDGEDLYSLVRDNKWTIDKYFEVTASIGKDLNGNGVWDENDLYAVSSNFKGIIGGLLTGADMDFTGVDANGVRSLNIQTNQSALELLTRLMNAFSVPGYNYNTATTVYDTTPDLFTTGHALFALTSAYGIDQLRAMEDDIGILPYPKYNENQEKYISPTYGNSLWVLPKTVDLNGKGEYIGMILEAMSFSGYYDIIPKYKEIVLKTKSARDNESADMIDIIFDSVVFTFDMNILFDAVLQTTILPAMWKDKSAGSIVSICQKYSPAISTYINKFLTAVDAA